MCEFYLNLMEEHREKRILSVASSALDELLVILSYVINWNLETLA